MKSISVLMSLILIITIVGCRTNISPSPGLGDPVPAPMNDPQVSVLSPELQPWIRFHPAVIVDDGARPLQVEVPVRNLTNRQYLIDYRFLFYDENGSELTPVMGWRMEAFEPKQVKRLKAGALSTDATAYRLEVRWAR